MNEPQNADHATPVERRPMPAFAKWWAQAAAGYHAEKSSRAGRDAKMRSSNDIGKQERRAA